MTDWTFDLDKDKLTITDHAIKQFVSRSKQMRSMEISRKPERTIRRLLRRAVEDESMDSVVKLKRLLNNHVIPAMYLVNSVWRFVIVRDGDQFVMVTAEIIEQK